MRALLSFLLLLALPLRAQEMVIEPQFDAAGTFHRGVAPVQRDGLWGLVNRTGAFVLEPTYLSIGRGRDGLFAVRTRDNLVTWTHIDARGKPVDEYPNDVQVTDYRQGWAAGTNGRNGWTLRDASGGFVSSTLFDEISDWDPPFALVQRAGQWQVVHVSQAGFVNALDAEFVEPMQIATGLSRISDGYVVVETPQGQTLLQIGRTGWRPEPGLRVVMYEPYGGARYYQHVGAVSDGFATVQDLSGRWGFYHLATDTELWMGRFERVRRFSEDYAAVQLDGKWGYIDRRGLFALSPRYDRAYDIHQGHGSVRLGDARGFVHVAPAGGLAEFISPRYEDVFRFQEGLAPVKLDGKWGYISNGTRPPAPLARRPVELLLAD